MYLGDAIFTFKVYLAANKVSFIPRDVHRYVINPKSIMKNEEGIHLKKVINDYLSLIINFKMLIDEISINQVKNSNLIISNINYKSTVSIYFMFLKIVKSNLSISDVNRIISVLEKIKAYPYSNFIGRDYNSLKFKISNSIFVKKYVFFIALYPLRILYKLNLIKLN